VKDVYSTESPVDAQIVRGVLESAGIAAVVENDVPTTWEGAIASRLRAWVRVLDGDAERARAIVAEWLSTRPVSAPWVCATCGEKMEGQFTACWECGTERPS
jgi:Putative prokaryotic signal transducing protein